MTGSKVAQYEMLDRLGAGGMGEIFRARDTRLNRMVAIKVLPKADADDEKRRRRFLHEAQSASGLNHPNIITVHDILSESGTDYLVMELVSGQTLADLIPEDGMVPSDVFNYGSQMAAAFAAAHAAGIVHRDIKPGNIMITGTNLVKVLDFGLAKATFKGFQGETAETMGFGAPLTNAGTIMGTVNYMSPEQAEGKNVDSRSDIFSFGIVLYQMVTGRSAFQSDSMIATMSAILRDEPTPVHELSPNAPVGLEEIINGCLRKNVEERTQSIDEVRVALDALRKSYNPGTSPTLPRAPVTVSATAATRTGAAATRAEAAVPAPQKPATLTYAIAGVLVLLAGAGGWWIATQRKGDAPAHQPAPVASAPAVPSPAAGEAVLTNDSIVKMVDAKVRTSAILDHIRASKTNFDLSDDGFIRLTKAGVPDSVIQAMRNPHAPAPQKSTAAVSTPAETPITGSSAAPTTPAPATLAVALADGLAIQVQLVHDIPNDAKAGTPLKFEVAKEILVDGTVVVAKGAAVNGSIADEGKKALLGGKKMTYELTDVETVNRQKLKVRATASVSPAGPARKAIEAGKKKVKDVASAAGTEYLAYIDGAQSVTIRR